MRHARPAQCGSTPTVNDISRDWRIKLRLNHDEKLRQQHWRRSGYHSCAPPRITGTQEGVAILWR